MRENPCLRNYTPIFPLCSSFISCIKLHSIKVFSVSHKSNLFYRGNFFSAVDHRGFKGLAGPLINNFIRSCFVYYWHSSSLWLPCLTPEPMCKFNGKRDGKLFWTSGCCSQGITRLRCLAAFGIYTP